MNPGFDNPLDYFNRWLATPIVLSGDDSVLSVMDALNRHPLAQDETAQDYVMPADRYREKPGRFRIFGENQDTWYYFIYDGRETERDPLVYFETCLDLQGDHGFDEENIIDGDHVVVGPFTRFLWWMLGCQIGLRLEGNGRYAGNIRGAVFSKPIDIDESLTQPLAEAPPSGYACFFSPDTICIPDWGAAFLGDDARERFVAQFAPAISSTWANR